MIKNGWWQECAHCSHKVTIDDIEDGYEDDDGNIIKLNPIENDHFIYCSQHCLDEKMRVRAEHDAKAENFKQKLLSLRPDLTFKEFRGKWPQCYCSASFTFDGAQCGGIVSYGTDGEVEWRISQSDLNVWDVYENKRKEAA
jgi:hypothetical protein